MAEVKQPVDEVDTEFTPVSWDELITEVTAPTPEAKVAPVTEPTEKPEVAVLPEREIPTEEEFTPISWDEARTSEIEPSPFKLTGGKIPQRPAYLDEPEPPEDEVLPVGALHPANLWHGVKTGHRDWLGYAPEQALSLITQAIDFFPGLVRGANETARSLWVAVLGPERTKQLEDLQHQLPVIGKLAELADKALDASGKLRQESRALLIQEAREQGGMVGVGVAVLVDSVEQTLMMIKGFRALKIGYGTQPGVISTLGAASVRAGLMAVTREGITPKQRLGAFALSMAYMSTPALSGTIGRWVKSDFIAKFADVAANFAITLPQLSTMVQRGFDEAEAQGTPEDGGFYFILNAIQSFGADVAFGVMTKAFRDAGQPRMADTINRVAKATGVFAEIPKKPVSPIPDLTAEKVTAAGIEATRGLPLEVRAPTLPEPFRLPTEKPIPEGIPAKLSIVTPIINEARPQEIQHLTESLLDSTKVERAYQVWVETPQGRATARGMEGTPAYESFRHEEFSRLLLSNTKDASQAYKVANKEESPIPMDRTERINLLGKTRGTWLAEKLGLEYKGWTKGGATLVFRNPATDELEHITSGEDLAKLIPTAPPTELPLWAGQKPTAAFHTFIRDAGEQTGDTKEILRGKMQEEIGKGYIKAKDDPTGTQTADMTPDELRGANEILYEMISPKPFIPVAPLSTADRVALQTSVSDVQMARPKAGEPDLNNYILDRPDLAEALKAYRGINPAAKADAVETISNDPRGEEMFATETVRTLINSIRHPLPTDPDSRRQTLFRFEATANAAINGRNMTDEENISKWDSVVRYVGMGVSSRYTAMSTVAEHTGDPTLVAEDWGRISLKNSANFVANNRIDEMYKSINMKPDLVGYITGRLDLDNAMKAYNGIHPATKEKKLLAMRAKAEKLISDDPRSKELFAFSDAWHKETTGMMAVNARRNEIREFGKLWDKIEKRYTKLNAKPEAELTHDEIVELDGLNKRLDRKLPYFFDLADETGKAIPLNKAVEALGKSRTMPVRKYIDFLNKVTWGTREYYYMTMHGLDIEARMTPETGVLPDYTESQLAEKVGVTPRINHRTGTPEFKNGSFCSDLRRYDRNLQVQADSGELTDVVLEKLNRYANEGYIPKGTVAEGLIDAMKMDWGYHKKIHASARPFYWVTRPFWTVYGLIANRVGWFGARNTGYQGMPWAASTTQLRRYDVAKAQINYPKELRNPNSNLRKFYDDRFKSNISHQKSMFYEGFMQLAPSERIVPPNRWWATKQAKLYEISAFTIGISDTFNRLQVSMMGDWIADYYVGRFVRGEINQAQVEHGLLLDAFPLGLRNYLMDLFTEAKFSDVSPDGTPRLNRPSFEKFVRETAEIKNMAINYPYRIGERSALEQNQDLRWVEGLSVFPRGTFELFWRTTIKPMVQATKTCKDHGWDSKHFDTETFKSGFRNLAANAIARAISMYLFAQVLGQPEKFGKKKRRGIELLEQYALKEQLGWEMGGIGYATVEKFLKNAGSLIGAVWEKDGEEAERAIRGLGDQILFFSIVIPTLKPIFEAIGNRRAMRNTDILMSILTAKFQGGKHTERNFYYALMHALIGTEPPQSESTEVKRLYEKVKGYLE